MTQMFGLRYGPDIRFQLEEETKESKDMKKELNKYKKEISMLEVQKYR